jgi:hypothetical protein
MVAYTSWKKQGRLLLACRVVGLALEALFSAECEQDFSCVTTEHCSSVEFWSTKHMDAEGVWSRPDTCAVPVLAVHRRLAVYLMKRLLVWLAGLGLTVKSAVVPKTRLEGSGHHDLVLKHTGTAQPYCQGFISTEVKISAVGENGRKFAAVWEAEKTRCEAAMARVLGLHRTPFGATMLVVIGIADGEELLSREPPLIVKAQLLTLNCNHVAKWGKVLLDRGTVPVEPSPPAPKRLRRGASWDEVRAALATKQHDIDDDGIMRVRLLDLFKAISATKTNKNLGQKLKTYESYLQLSQPQDFKRKRFPASQRGQNSIWLTMDAVQKIYDYEVRS